MGARERDTLCRAARCPMVLLDFNFQRVAWWSRVIDGRGFGESRRSRLTAFHTEEANPSKYDLLLEAWSAARSMSRTSSLAFGMAPEIGHDADSSAFATGYRSYGRPQRPGHEFSLGYSAYVLARNYSTQRPKWMIRFLPTCTCIAFSYWGAKSLVHGASYWHRLLRQKNR